ncbi:hypothetical protein C5B91_20135 [Haloferax sp. Atlit-10N]|nr:hypothetical protein C5B87_19395 [Haloferax sp. Atlit-16N]RDZ53947.1 hypothetical protein C5B91_20135 [Haloferax sp. Atlit-10N]
MRVRVDFQQNGSNPVAEVDRDFVRFQNQQPTASGPSLSGGSTTRTSQPNLSVTVDDPEFASAQGDDVTVEWIIDGSTVHEQQISSAGVVSYNASGLTDGSHSWSVELNDSYGATSTSSTWSFTVDHYEPVVNNSTLTPADQTNLTTQSVNLSAEVSDRDFAIDGDSLTVEFIVDGSVVGQDTLSSNGTAKTEYEATSGSFNWSVQVTDQYGSGVDTVSTSQLVTSPSTVTIRNVSSGAVITDTADVEARLFSGEMIFTKNVTNGQIDLTGIPPGEGYILQLRVDGYVLRTVALRSVYDQSTAYLLPENASSVYNEFQLNDNTNEFGTSETILYIERPIEDNGSLEWRTVTGDYFGSDGVFKTTLERDQRYRLIIENTDGDRRELGSYIASTDTSATLSVGEIVWRSPEGETFQWDAYIDGESDPNVLKFAYSDPESQTASLNLTVFERGNRSNVLFETNQAGSITSFQRTEPLSQNESETQWVVNFTVTRNEADTTVQKPISGVAGVSLPVDQRWLTLGGYLLLIGIGALFPSTMARTGAAISVAVATGLTWLGIVPIPIEVIGLAGAIALLGVVAEFNGGY